MKRTNSGICLECRFCKRLYRKILYEFKECKEVYCLSSDKMIALKDRCARFERNAVKCELTVKQIDDAIEDVAAISRYIELLGCDTEIVHGNR